MKTFYLSVLISILCRVATSEDWCYQSQITANSTCKGPDEWVKVDEQCGGTKQSPINIVTKRVVLDRYLTPVQFTGYQETHSAVILNNGHTVQVIWPGRAVINIANLTVAYKAMQFHLHWGKNGGPGSEHSIDGERYPMELHIVHIKEHYNSLDEAANDNTGIAVLGFLYEESESSNKKYEHIINSLDNITHPDTNTTLPPLSLDMLIPSHDTLNRYYRYNGSLTTPHCNETVVWTVFEQTIPLSKNQLVAFSKLQFHGGISMVDTFRPIQPRNGREVHYSSSYILSVSTALLVSSVFTTLCVLTG